MKIQSHVLYFKCHRAVQVILATSLDYHKNTTVEQFKAIKLAPFFIFFFPVKPCSKQAQL